MATIDRTELRELVTKTVLDPDFRRATFGGAAHGGSSRWVRVVVARSSCGANRTFSSRTSTSARTSPRTSRSVTPPHRSTSCWLFDLREST